MSRLFLIALPFKLSLTLICCLYDLLLYFIKPFIHGFGFQLCKFLTYIHLQLKLLSLARWNFLVLFIINLLCFLCVSSYLFLLSISILQDWQAIIDLDRGLTLRITVIINFHCFCLALRMDVHALLSFFFDLKLTDYLKHICERSYWDLISPFRLILFHQYQIIFL